MRNLFGLLVIFGGLMLTTGTSYALSCASPMPTFDDEFEKAPIAIRGTVIDISFTSNSEDVEYCSHIGADESLVGEYTFTIDVHETYKGQGVDRLTLTRTYDALNCSWGGGCHEMEKGKEYVILSQDGKTLGSGLCGPCPYMPIEEFTPPEENMCICTREYMPVCGVDGQTYGNECGLLCDGVKKAHDGECNDANISTPVVPQQGISNTCTSWFDGCNTCSVKNGKLGFCTEMACITKRQAKCVAFEFSYLSENQAKVVKQRVHAYMNKFSETDRQAKRALVLENIEKKRADIQYILATSLFPAGSKTLDSYMLVLELLDLLEAIV